MWFYLSLTICSHVFGATDSSDPLYQDGVVWANICFGYYSLVTFLFALIMPLLVNKIGTVKLHFSCLVCGGLGLLSIGFIQNQYLLLLSMTGVGIAWASIISIPYAIIARDIPAKQMGIFMGLFNMFIVLPEIIAALGFGFVMSKLSSSIKLHEFMLSFGIPPNNKLYAVMLGGVLILIAALLTLRLQPKRTN